MEVPDSAKRVRFGDWFSEAWGLLTGQWQTWFLISLTVVIPIMTFNVLLIWMGVSAQIEIFKADPFKFLMENLSQSLSFNLLTQFSITIVESFFIAGMLNTAFKQLSGEPIEISDLFTGFEHFINVLVALLISNLLQFFGFQLCIIPGLIVQGLLFLTIPLVIRKGMAPLEALQASFQATRHDWIMFSLFAAAVQVVTVLGVFAFCIGFVFLFPLLYLTMALAYRDLFEPELKPQSAVDALYTKYCRQCGSPLPVQASFCDRCGASQV